MKKILNCFLLIILVTSILLPHTLYAAEILSQANDPSESQNTEPIAYDQTNTEGMGSICFDNEVDLYGNPCTNHTSAATTNQQPINNEVDQTPYDPEQYTSLTKHTDADEGTFFLYKSSAAPNFPGEYINMSDQPLYLTTSEGEIVWCYQPLLPHQNATKTSTTPGSWYAFTDKQQLNMAMVAAFAEEKYYATGNKDYLYGGQMMIWMYGGYVVEGVPSSYSNEMNDINKLITNYTKVPSFASDEKNNAPVHKLTWNASSQQYQKELTDNNKVLESQFSSLYGGEGKCKSYSVYKFCDSGSNQVTVSTTSHTATNPYSIKTTYDPIPHVNESKSYWYTGNQDLIDGFIDPRYMYFSVEADETTAQGNAKLCKVDESSKPISGLKFELYNSSNKYITTYTTDSKGCFTTSKLIPGSYYFVEKDNINDSYENINSHINFTIYPPATTGTVTTIVEYKNGTAIEDKVVNKYIRSNPYEFTTVDCEGNPINLEDEVQYQIYTSNGATFEIDGDELPVITTNKDGVATIPSLIVGDYYLLELEDESDNVLEDTASSGEYGQKFYFTVNKDKSVTFDDGINMCTGTTTEGPNGELPTGTTDTDLKIQNTRATDVYIDSIYSEMNNDQVVIEMSTSNYIMPGSYFYLNLEYTQGDYTNVLTQQIDLTTGVDNYTHTFTVPLVDKGQEFDSFRAYITTDKNNIDPQNELTNKRYYPSKEATNIATEEGKYTPSTPIGSRTCRADYTSPVGECSEFFEHLEYAGIYQDYLVTEGWIPIDVALTYTSDCGYYNIPINDEHSTELQTSVIKMYQPLSDSTFKFDQVTYADNTPTNQTQDDNYYVFPMVYNTETQKLEIKDFYGEASNGRFYMANTEYIDNPSTEQEVIYQGYTDKNDILIAVEDWYPLPIDGETDQNDDGEVVGEEAFYQQYWQYYITLDDVGLNEVDYTLNQTYFYETKASSMFEENGLTTPIGTAGDNSTFEGWSKETAEQFAITGTEEEFKAGKVYANSTPAATESYVSTNPHLYGYADFLIAYPELENIPDDYYLDYGDYGGEGIYETNYVGDETVVKTPADF